MEKRCNNGKIFSALLTDLSNTLDCLSHEFIIAKLHASGFNLPALKLIHSYFFNRKQHTKVNHAYRVWQDILFEVPQGSIIRPILFKIFPIDLYLVTSHTDFSSYADDNTIHDYIADVISSFQESSENFFHKVLRQSNETKCR